MDCSKLLSFTSTLPSQTYRVFNTPLNLILPSKQQYLTKLKRLAPDITDVNLDFIEDITVLYYLDYNVNKIKKYIKKQNLSRTDMERMQTYRGTLLSTKLNILDSSMSPVEKACATYIVVLHYNGSANSAKTILDAVNKSNKPIGAGKQDADNLFNFADSKPFIKSDIEVEYKELKELGILLPDPKLFKFIDVMLTSINSIDGMIGESKVNPFLQESPIGELQKERQASTIPDIVKGTPQSKRLLVDDMFDPQIASRKFEINTHYTKEHKTEKTIIIALDVSGSMNTKPKKLVVYTIMSYIENLMKNSKQKYNFYISAYLSIHQGFYKLKNLEDFDNLIDKVIQYQGASTHLGGILRRISFTLSGGFLDGCPEDEHNNNLNYEAKIFIPDKFGGHEIITSYKRLPFSHGANNKTSIIAISDGQDFIVPCKTTNAVLHGISIYTNNIKPTGFKELCERNRGQWKGIKVDNSE